jgi:hypothetical protein
MTDTHTTPGLQLINYATETRPKQVKLVDGVLTYSRKDGADWVNINVEGVFAFDFLTLTHGWRKFPEKGSGLPVSHEMQPAEIAWTSEDAQVMKADGWRFLLIAKVASKEFGGLAEIQAPEPALITAITALYNEFLVHPDAAEGTVPLVSHQVSKMGEQTMRIEGFIPRPKVFGQPCNTLPARPEKVAPVAAPSEPARSEEAPTASVESGKGAKNADLLAKLHERNATKKAASNGEASPQA